MLPSFLGDGLTAVGAYGPSHPSTYGYHGLVMIRGDRIISADFVRWWEVSTIFFHLIGNWWTNCSIFKKNPSSTEMGFKRLKPIGTHHRKKHTATLSALAAFVEPRWARSSSVCSLSILGCWMSHKESCWIILGGCAGLESVRSAI